MEGPVPQQGLIKQLQLAGRCLKLLGKSLDIHRSLSNAAPSESGPSYLSHPHIG